MLSKNELRPRLWAIRAQIADREAKENRLYESFDRLTAAYRTLFVYVSMGSEVDTRRILARTDKRLFVPYVEGNALYPVAYDGGQLNPDRLGNTGRTSRYDGAIDCVVVPMLGFNAGLYRIGYGGGYYDRFLKKRAFSVGLGFDECQCEFVPEPHDVPLDAIVTPTRLLFLKEK